MTFTNPGRWVLLALGILLAFAGLKDVRNLVPAAICLVVSAGLFARREFLRRREERLRRTGQRVEARFVEVRSTSDEGDTEYRIVAERFDAVAQRHVSYYSAPLRDDPKLSIPAGPIVVVLDPEDPGRYLMDLPFLTQDGRPRRAPARTDGPSVAASDPRPVFIFAAIFAGIAWFTRTWIMMIFVAWIVLQSLHDFWRRLRRVARGPMQLTPVDAIVLEATTRLDELDQGRATYRLAAQGFEPTTGGVRTFYSDRLAADPGAFAPAGTPVRVLVDPQYPEEYTMDVSFLPPILLSDRPSEFGRLARFVPWPLPVIVGVPIVAAGTFMPAQPNWIVVGAAALLAALSAPMYRLHRRDAHRAWRRRSFGRRVEATVLGVGRDTSLTINGENPWRLFAQWHDTERQRLVVFGTDSFWERPAWLEPGLPVTVTVDPDDTCNFEMQLPATRPLQRRQRNNGGGNQDRAAP
jgi:hypothetical protein